METIEIRQIGLDNTTELQQIGRLTFTETFAEHNSPENLTDYLEESFATVKLTNELKNPDSRFYFAFVGSKVAGYLKINFGKAQTEDIDPSAMEIERIYVLKEFQGKKVGQSLFQKAMGAAAESGAYMVWLGVWEKNHKALNFYRKNGFEAFDQHIFRIGDDEQTDFLMKRSL